MHLWKNFIIKFNMQRITIVLMIVHITCFPLVSMVIKSAGFIRNLDYDNLYFTQHFIQEYTDVLNVKRCAGFCGRQADCSSFFYNTVDRRCRLHYTTHFLYSDGISLPGWKLYVLENKECPVHLSFIHDEANGLCVHLSNKIYNFTAGRTYCSERNSNMITLETEQKRIAFSNLIDRNDISPMFVHNIYLGLHKTNGVWVWESGELLQASNWGISQPYCPPGLACECASLVREWDGNMWNDDLCKWPMHIVCEYPN